MKVAPRTREVAAIGRRYAELDLVGRARTAIRRRSGPPRASQKTN